MKDIKRLLEQLKLKGMLERLDELASKADKKGYTPLWLLHQLLQEEYRYCQERSQENRLKQAKIPWEWTLDTEVDPKKWTAS